MNLYLMIHDTCILADKWFNILFNCYIIIYILLTIHGKYLAGENFGEVKAIGEEKLVNKQQYAIYVFVYLWILVKKILANGSRCVKFANFSPTKIFLCTVHFD